MRMGPVSFLALLGVVPVALPAQRQASLGAGTGVVRYAGGSSFSALTIAPAAQSLSSSSYLAASGSVSLLEAGVWASQGRSDVWAAFATVRGVRVAGSGTLGFGTRSDGLAAGSASALIEAVPSRNVFALGAGVVTGFIQQVPGVAAFRVRARAWWQYHEPTQLSLTTEATHLLGAWYTDVVGGVSYDSRRTVASLWLSGRLSKTYGSTGAASASVQYFLTPSVALEAAGGNYLRDPFQGLPRAGFIAGGVRVFTSRRAIAPAAGRPNPALQPLVAEHRGDTLVVRFHMPGARQLAIAGNWNAWTPASLHAVGDEVWEATLQLQPGTYYFNLVVDGKEWVVPGGVATIPDGMGGLIAVLNVL